MIRRLPVVVGALVFASTIGVANAGHIRFGGSVHWSGGVHVGVSNYGYYPRPAYRPYRWSVGGSVYVGPSYYYPRPYYYYYYPSYVPSYYSTSYYYPVEPAPQTAAPGMVAVAPAARPALAKFGIGVFLGGSSVQSPYGDASTQSQDLGLLARFRLTPGLLVEGDIGKTSYNVNGIDSARVDRRLGLSLLWEIGAYNRWAPYLLIGGGVQQADIGGGQYQTAQDFGEIGAGLRWAISRNFHLTADIRAGTRKTVADSPNTMTLPANTTARTITPPPAASDQNEDYTRFRLAALLYF